MRTSMLYYWLLFFFVTVGAKLALALLTVYLLLPDDRRCSRCDGETLLLRPNRAGRLAIRLLLGRVEWRWCPGCGWQGLARRSGAEPRRAGLAIDSTAPTRR